MFMFHSFLKLALMTASEISTVQVDVVGSLDPSQKLVVVAFTIKEKVQSTCDYIAKVFGFKVDAADEVVCSIEEWKLKVRAAMSSRTRVFLEEQQRANKDTGKNKCTCICIHRSTLVSHAITRE